jgi:hypothetical protein
MKRAMHKNRVLDHVLDHQTDASHHKP